MRLVIVAPGHTPIPPIGWGAVESLIWDYKIFIEKYHTNISCIIVNVPGEQQIIESVNSLKPDIVHIHNDDIAKYSHFIQCPRVFMTSHYAYLSQIHTRPQDPHLMNVAAFIRSGRNIMCLSPEISQVYQMFGCSPSRLIVQPNGANDEIFRFTDTPKYPERSLCLARIQERKGQYKLQSDSSIYFAGRYEDSNFDVKMDRYLGEWTKVHLYENMTDYGNLVLLSDGEAHALVVAEALVSGLGVVVSEPAAANLDLSMPFIDVVPNGKDPSEIIRKNRETSITMRTKIREYGVKKFGWKAITDKYLKALGLVS
jgi:glycosyltransferase involved in cell wall biosynthesis